MPGYKFKDENGNETVIHALSRCTVRKGSKIILDSNDIFEPAEGVEPDPEDDYGWGDCVFDRDALDLFKELPIKVQSAEVKDDGTIRMRLDRNYHFAVMPWRENLNEGWRIFSPGEHKGIVFYGNGTVDDYAGFDDNATQSEQGQ